MTSFIRSKKNIETSAYQHSPVLLWLTVLTCACLLYFCRSLFIPITIAAFLALFSSPLVTLLCNMKIPRMIAAFIVVLILVVLCSYIVSVLIEPASEWIQRLPIISDRLTDQVNEVSKSLSDFNKSLIPGNQDKQQGNRTIDSRK